MWPFKKKEVEEPTVEVVTLEDVYSAQERKKAKAYKLVMDTTNTLLHLNPLNEKIRKVYKTSPFRYEIDTAMGTKIIELSRDDSWGDKLTYYDKEYGGRVLFCLTVSKNNGIRIATHKTVSAKQAALAVFEIRMLLESTLPRTEWEQAIYNKEQFINTIVGE